MIFGKSLVKIIAIAAAILSFLVFVPSVRAVEFTADTIESLDTTSLHGKIYVKDSFYRLDQFSGGKRFIVLVDQASCLTRALSIEDSTFVEMPCDGEISLQNDCIQANKKMSENATIVPAGTEMVNGYECEKSEMQFEGQKIATQWVSRKLNFPIRIVVHAFKNKIFELQNIKEEPVPETYFQMPAYYSRIEKFERKINPPAWIGEVPGAPVMELPIETVISADDMFKIKVVLDRPFFIKIASETDEPSVVSVTPFKNGKNTRDANNVLLKSDKKGKIIVTTCQETPSKADEIVVRVVKGKVSLKAEPYEPKK